MEPTRSQPNRLARKLFWAFLIISLFPVAVIVVAAYALAGEQLLKLPVFLQQRMLIALIALALVTTGLVWLLVRQLGQRIGALARSVRLAAQGRPAEPASIAGNDEIAETAQWFNRLADQLAHNQNLLMSQDNEDNTTRRQAAALVAQQALMAGSLDDLMRNAVDLFLRHYGCSFGALYLLESKELASKIHITLAYTAGSLNDEARPFTKRYAEKRVNLDRVPTMDWMVGRALASRRPQVGPAAPNSIVYEAALPLIQPSVEGPLVIGALDLLSTSRTIDTRMGPFSVRTVAEMQGIANVLALAISGFTTTTALHEGSSPTRSGSIHGGPPTGGLRLDAEVLYTAVRQIAQAQSADRALDALRAALRNTSYASAILVSPGDAWAPALLAQSLAGRAADEAPAAPVVSASEPENTAVMQVVICRALRTQPPGMNEPPLVLPSPRLASLEAFFKDRIEHENRDATSSAKTNPQPLLLYDLDLQSEDTVSSGGVPGELITIARRMGCRSAAFLPALREGRLAAVLMVGIPPEIAAPLLRADVLEPFPTLVQLTAAALERIHNATFIRRKLAEIETLWEFTHAISMETDLNVLLRLLHHQTERAVGAIDSFAVGLYDAPANTVRFPYMLEGGKQLNIPTFPLGAGLSSEVIRTRKPMLLSSAEEVQSKSVELGVVQVGEAARSWLGAPMVYAGEVVGLIIVQDTLQERRFTTADAQLLSTLAAQVAVVVRNARLLDATRRQARQERLVNEITDRIRRSVDVQSILKTTADELGQALGAKRAAIRIGLGGQEILPPDTGDAPGEDMPFEPDWMTSPDVPQLESSLPGVSMPGDIRPWTQSSVQPGALYEPIPTDDMPAASNAGQNIERSAAERQDEANRKPIHHDATRPDPGAPHQEGDGQVGIEIPLVPEPLPHEHLPAVPSSNQPGETALRSISKSAFTLEQNARPVTADLPSPNRPHPPAERVPGFVDLPESLPGASDSPLSSASSDKLQSANTRPDPDRLDQASGPSKSAEEEDPAL